MVRIRRSARFFFVDEDDPATDATSGDMQVDA